jgi:Domain of unknown function (DUF4845)
MRANPQQQQGMTLIGMAIAVIVVGFWALIAIRLVPLYLDNQKVSGAFRTLKSNPDLVSMPASGIRRALQKQFEMNYVDFIDIDKVDITSIPGYVKMSIGYERVTPIIGNVSVLLTFDQTVEVGSK